MSKWARKEYPDNNEKKPVLKIIVPKWQVWEAPNCTIQKLQILPIGAKINTVYLLVSAPNFTIQKMHILVQKSTQYNYLLQLH